MKLDEEQREEVRQAVLLWKSYLSNQQANVILTAQRKEALATLVAVAEQLLQEAALPPSQ